MASAGTRSILVVEELAHWRNGHFPVRCAQLATGYAELGYTVELLTSEGWAHQREHPDSPFTVRRYRGWARQVKRVAARSESRISVAILTLLLVAEARAAARRMRPTPDAVIVLGWRTDPVLLAASAGHGRWLLNPFRTPQDFPTSRMDLSRLERRRRAGGGRVRLAVASTAMREQWARRVPYLEPVVTPIAGTRDVAPIDDPRRRMGLDERGKVALVFGERTLKQRELVFDAFDRLPDWTLVVAGTVADDVEATERRMLFPGAHTDEARDVMFAAADLVVLPFPPHYRKNSGTLMDAISTGVPVVCPDDADATEIVVRHHLGTTYTNGDCGALVDAVRHSPDHLDPVHLAAARREHSNAAVARRQLLALGIVDPAPN
jgi:glycosyltransferase involved in cell wall biosynthesis